MEDEWTRWHGRGRRKSPVSDKGRYNQIIASDMRKRKKRRRQSVGKRWTKMRHEDYRRPPQLY